MKSFSTNQGYGHNKRSNSVPNGIHCENVNLGRQRVSKFKNPHTLTFFFFFFTFVNWQRRRQRAGNREMTIAAIVRQSVEEVSTVEHLFCDAAGELAEQ